MPIARDMGLESAVTEWPARVPYLDALQILLDSDAVVLLGSDAPHYTASKVFPYILSRKPLLAIFHQESSVVKIISETRAGRVITFDSANRTPAHGVPEIRAWLEKLLPSPAELLPDTDWAAFEAYTTRAMSRRLAEALDQVVRKHAGELVGNCAC
jgi:hypothetical protein